MNIKYKEKNDVNVIAKKTQLSKNKHMQLTVKTS